MDVPPVSLITNQFALFLHARANYAQAEPLYRRALGIDEASLGPDHRNVARDLNNLAVLLQDTNRLSEAEPLMRRALAIDEASFGPDHRNVARDLNNLALLLQATNRLSGRRTADAESPRNFPSIHRRHWPRTSSPKRGHCE
jgi:tetratricopeptide (TPR) repeat protein